MVNYFDQNITLLDKRHGRLAQKLLLCKDEIVILPIEETKSGKSTVKVKNNNGSEKYIHSLYDPVHEAQAFNNIVLNNREATDIFIIFGIGLGYHIIDLIRRIAPTQTIIAIEPDLSIFMTILTYSNAKDLLSDKRVAILAENNREIIKEQLKSMIISWVYKLQASPQIRFVDFYKKNMLFPEIASVIKETIEQMPNAIADSKINVDPKTLSINNDNIPKSYQECLDLVKKSIKPDSKIEESSLLLLSAYYLFCHYTDGELLRNRKSGNEK